MTKPLFLYSDFDFIYSNIPEKRLELMKRHFVKCLDAMIDWERKTAISQGIKPLFTDERRKEVLGYVEKIKDFYQLEALKKIIFDENLLPDSFEDIEKGAEFLRLRRDEII